MKQLVIAGLLLSILVLCNPAKEEGCTPISNPDKAIELVSPSGGETFTLGRSVNVNWKVDPSIVEKVVVQVSTSGSSGPWRNIYGHGIAVPSEGEVVCMDTVWTIGDESEDVQYSASGTVNIRVAWYNHETEESAMSSMITINQ